MKEENNQIYLKTINFSFNFCQFYHRINFISKIKLRFMSIEPVKIPETLAFLQAKSLW
jgi:hypothetical protein